MSGPITVYALHALGGSGGAFAALAEHLADGIRLVPIDLPGFGTARDLPPRGVEETATHVLAEIARDGAPRWLVLGHSMGGKIASVVARRALEGVDAVFGLAGVVLLAGSPTVPEPMGEDKRAEMLAWASGGPLDAEAARTFVDDNAARPLRADLDARALADLQGTAPEAWRLWLTEGSRTDVGDRVGTLDVPALVVGGEDDDDLGAGAQVRLHGAVYPRARFVRLAETGHLLPQERPAEVAAAIAELVADIDEHAPIVPAAWAALIADPTVAPRVRASLAARAIADDPAYRPRVLDADALDTLRRLAAVLVPQPDGGRIDLAARVDRQLAAGEGDGWRPADLPPDPVAAGAALRDIGDAVRRDATATVRGLVAGELHPAGAALSPAQLQAWCEDVRVDLVRHWLAHPASLARTGNDSFATRGGAHPRGFTALGANIRVGWEPADLGRVATPEEAA